MSVNVKQLTGKATPATKDDLAVRYCRPADVQRMTGYSRSEVYRAIYAGELEAFHRPGSRVWLIPVDAVDKWIRGDDRAA